jgi:hypothetical protein
MSEYTRISRISFLDVKLSGHLNFDGDLSSVKPGQNSW